jgi:hypothetical protein
VRYTAFVTVIAGVLAAATLFACEPVPPHASTVSYYRTHERERRERVAECAQDPARAKREPACINALVAERAERIGSYRDLPPPKFPPVERVSSPEHSAAELP